MEFVGKRSRSLKRESLLDSLIGLMLSLALRVLLAPRYLWELKSKMSYWRSLLWSSHCFQESSLSAAADFVPALVKKSDLEVRDPPRAGLGALVQVVLDADGDISLATANSAVELEDLVEPKASEIGLVLSSWTSNETRKS